MTLNGILCLDIAAVIVKIKQHIAELYVLFQTTAVKLIYHVFVEIRREIEWKKEIADFTFTLTSIKFLSRMDL